MNWLNYHHLQYFWVVAQEESISRAGERLRLAPSTISMQISKLEDSLGGKLFVRTGRSLELTELGKLTFQYANEIFTLGQEMLDALRGASRTGPHLVAVGIVDVVPKLMARKFLEPILSLTDELRLTCHEGKEKQLLGELAVHTLDLVLTDTPVKSGLSIKAYSHLLAECGVSFCAIDTLATTRRETFPLSLNKAPMLLPTPMSSLRGNLDQWFSRLNIRPKIVAEFDDHALMKAFGQAGDGIFPIPTLIEEEVCRQHGVSLVGRSEDVKERFYAISVERIIKHPAVMAIWNAAKSSPCPVETQLD